MGAVTPGLAACPVPAARTETESAAVVGTLRRDDDTPLAGVPVAVSTSWNADRCDRIVARTTTDATGAFRLPATTRRCKVTWIVPNLDRLPPTFRVCAVTTGGRWTGGASAGFYRVLFAEEPTRVKGYDRPVSRVHAYVQWVEPATAGRPAAVRATAAVPADPEVELDRGGDLLRDGGGGWQLLLGGTRNRPLNNFSAVRLAFALGGPGEVAAAGGR